MYFFELLISLYLVLIGYALLYAPIIIIILILIKNKKNKGNKEKQFGSYYPQGKRYNASSYCYITKKSFSEVINNKGTCGEYLIYKSLRHFEREGARFLFNIYVPREDGKMSEIDVLMIHKKGLFVFESKNYSGWIFGDENQSDWYQTLCAGKNGIHKECFYNPIMQNRSHIKYLKTFLKRQVPMHSIVVFSNRCTLKRIKTYNNDTIIIYRDNIIPTVNNICNQIPNVLNDNNIVEIYNKLYPYTQVDNATRMQHIANIHKTQPYN